MLRRFENPAPKRDFVLEKKKIVFKETKFDLND